MIGFRLSSTVLAAPDPRALAAFYRALLDWETRDDEPDWVVLKPRGTGQGAAAGRRAGHARPGRAPVLPVPRPARRPHRRVKPSALPGQEAVASRTLVSCPSP